MKYPARIVVTLTFVTAVAGCAQQQQPQNVIMMDGKAEGVVIQYYGDVNATLPLARQHCAAYERVPVRRSYSAEKNLVIYACVAP
jgi:hypothetical protein